MESDFFSNIIFAGTPEFAATILNALLNSKHRVSVVYTQPDRPAGRGRKLTESPVKTLAQAHNLPVYQPVTLRDPVEQEHLSNLKADLMVVVAYGLILPKPVLAAPRLGCINVHASLLPRFRGAAPIQRAILAGDKVAGVTLMQMDEGLDTGDMLYKAACDILPTDTSADLHDRLAILGANALLATLDQLLEGAVKPIKQEESLATYAHKITKEEAKIDWQQPAELLARTICAFDPWPVAFTSWQGHPVRLWQAIALPAEEISAQTVPGQILRASKEGLDVVTGAGILRILKLQLPGGKTLAIKDFLNAVPPTQLVGAKLT